MSDQQTGTETPGVLDIGAGNKFTVADVVALKFAKEGLETEVGTLKQANDLASQELEKLKTGSYNANQGRIQSDSARETAETRIKELETQVSGLKPPEDVSKLQEQVDLLLLEKYDGKINKMAEALKQKPEDFHGKTVEELAIWEQIIALQPKPKTDPTIDRSGTGVGDATDARSNSHQTNLDTIKAYREKNK